MPQHVICFRTQEFLGARRICVPLYLETPSLPVPVGDPYAHLKALGTIAQLAGSLSEMIPMRKELIDVAQRALETAVDGLGEGAELVDLAVSPAPTT